MYLANPYTAIGISVLVSIMIREIICDHWRFMLAAFRAFVWSITNLLSPKNVKAIVRKPLGVWLIIQWCWQSSMFIHRGSRLLRELRRHPRDPDIIAACREWQTALHILDRHGSESQTTKVA